MSELWNKRLGLSGRSGWRQAWERPERFPVPYYHAICMKNNTQGRLLHYAKAQFTLIIDTLGIIQMRL